MTSLPAAQDRVWRQVLSDLHRWADSTLALADWLQACSPGQSLLVACDTPRQMGNIQSRVNRICQTRNLRASATRVAGGVLVCKLP